jgi:hypothetical protein
MIPQRSLVPGSAQSPIGEREPGGTRHSMLTLEADVLHRQIFGRPAPAELAKYYAQAHAEMADLTEATEQEIRTVRVVVERGLDAPAIEPWLRAQSRRHLLSRKLSLIMYLAECGGRHAEFRVRAVGRIGSFLRLGASAIAAAARLSCGRLQKMRHGLL